MAKSNKNPIPVISQPSGGLQSWLSEQTKTVTTPTPVEDAPKSDVTPNQTVASAQVEQSVDETVSTDDPAKEVAVQTGIQPVKYPDSKGVIKGAENQNLSDVAITASLVTRKPKSRVGEGEKSGTYPETFFKKPVKAEGDTSSSEAKPVRISEESHWLLSVLVNQARRQGHKLNVGDLVDNLLANHRMVYKNEVDELIAKWKSRKRFD